jgi:hypothetical protein
MRRKTTHIAKCPLITVHCLLTIWHLSREHSGPSRHCELQAQWFAIELIADIESIFQERCHSCSLAKRSPLVSFHLSLTASDTLVLPSLVSVPARGVQSFSVTAQSHLGQRSSEALPSSTTYKCSILVLVSDFCAGS